MDDVSALRFQDGPCTGPCFFRTEMNVSNPIDTFLDTHGMNKGMLWLNRRPLGRFWSIGPQFALYVPGPWLKSGQNDILFFDLQGTMAEGLKSTDHPAFVATTSERN